MDLSTVAIGDVVLLPLIVGLIQYVKSFRPNANGDIWRGLSFVLGLLGQTVVFLLAHSGSVAGWQFGTWALCVVTGLGFGLASGKAFDEAITRGLLNPVAGKEIDSGA